MNKIKFLILFIILVTAFIFRIWMIGQVPPSPDWDEVSLGYNAYSILLTGRDEYGQFLPLVLRSYDDYKPALYTYLIIPFIKIFDLNIISVRLPSVIFGVLAVLGTYLLAKEIFNINNKYKQEKKYVTIISLLSAAFLAISPWHLQFSRVAFESSVAASFNIFTALFFIKGLKRNLFFVFSFIVGALNIYMYQSEKVFVPLFFLLFIMIFKNEVLKIRKKWLVISVLSAFLIVLPMMFSIVTNQDALMRAKGVSIFSDQTQFLKQNSEKILIDRLNKNYLGLILDNRRIEYVKAVIAGYISHFDLNWLFITGDINRHHAPFMGIIYLYELPLILIGIYKLVFGEFDKKTKIIIFSWFLISPIPASVTSGVPHAVRTLNFLPTFQIFSALGLIEVIGKIMAMQKPYFKFPIMFFISILILLNISYYLNQYFVQQNYYYSEDWQYGYKEAVSYVAPIAKNYDKIIVSNVAPLDQSYMFFLFYLKYPPFEYQKSGGTVSGGFRENHKGFANYTFKPIDWNKENESGKTLYVGIPSDFPSDVKVLDTINYLNGKPAILVVSK